MTLTAVALLLHSMENSIVLIGLRAVFLVTSNNNYQSNYSLFEAHGSILGQVTMQEVRDTVCVCAVGTRLNEEIFSATKSMWAMINQSNYGSI